MTGRSILCGVVLSLVIPLAAAQQPATQAAPPPAVPSGSLIVARTVPFQVGQPIKLDLVAGSLRVPDLRIEREDGSMIDSLLPPRGGQSRYSWLRYSLAAENPDTQTWTLRARLRLLDRNGAVIDEFELDRRIGKGRARTADLRRLTLNYVVPLVDRVEVTLSGER